MDDACAWCGKKAAGYAFVGPFRYCHDDERSCYQKAQEAKISLSVLTARDMSLTIKRKKERS